MDFKVNIFRDIGYQDRGYTPDDAQTEGDKCIGGKNRIIGGKSVDLEPQIGHTEYCKTHVETPPSAGVDTAVPHVADPDMGEIEWFIESPSPHR